MSGILIDKTKCTGCSICINKCPFKALELIDNVADVNAACKMCRICIKTCPFNAISVKETKNIINKNKYQNVLIFVEHNNEIIHPVTFELIGKGLELANSINQEVHCILIGYNVNHLANQLLEYGVNKVFVYDNINFEHFKVDIYANAFEDCINNNNHSVVLIGATTTGRSLAPRMAVRFKTGLTADCTILEIRDNTDLVQVRPAFGGNVMAQIITTNHRPQFATVRYKVMDAASKTSIIGEIINCSINNEKLNSKIEIKSVNKKKEDFNIAEAEIIVVAGNGIKDQETMNMINNLAQKLKGVVGITRPLVEKNMGSIHQQIGLSGRSVKPKLIICFGVSGAIQFTAGMDKSELIIAVNNDPNAPIFDIAHISVVSDAKQTLIEMLNLINNGGVLV